MRERRTGKVLPVGVTIRDMIAYGRDGEEFTAEKYALLRATFGPNGAEVTITPSARQK